MTDALALPELPAFLDRRETVPGRSLIPVVDIGASVTRNGLNLPDDLAFEGWCEIGVQLRQAEKAVGWLIGEWWNYGARYGERVHIVKSPEWKGPSHQACRDYAWTASRFDVSRRHDRLPFAHHREVAALDPVEADAILQEAEANNLSASQVRGMVKGRRREQREAALAGKQLALPEKRFGFILADLGTKFETWSEVGKDRSAENHYTTESDDKLTELMVDMLGKIAAKDAILGLWTTVAKLQASLRIMSQCGFDYKSARIWVKDVVEIELTPEQRAVMGKGRFLKVVGNHGTGYWGLDRAEMLLIGARGNVVAPAMGKQGENVWYARRGEHAKTREEVHSDKPERSFLWIEKHWPNTPKIELFARGARAGWARWGNQAAASA